MIKFNFDTRDYDEIRREMKRAGYEKFRIERLPGGRKIRSEWRKAKIRLGDPHIFPYIMIQTEPET